LPSADVGVSARVEFENGWSRVEPRSDKKIDDSERANDVVAALKLLVEHRKIPLDPPIRVGDDARVVARLIEYSGLDDQLPGKRIHRSFRTADPTSTSIGQPVPGSLGLRRKAPARGVWLQDT